MNNQINASPYPIRREDALRAVQETGFAVDDIVLYLDTHGNCPRAMEYYRYAVQAYQAAKTAYESAFGPLTCTGVNENNWSWNNGPWPWEGGR